ncbi:MAG: 3-oxoacyl-[acyl-carrier-protein] synthase III C-terminal domain-containing protein [Lawsonibacter sp.]
MVCHQANARIIDHVAKKLKAREGLFYKNMERYGNTSAASIPIALDELVGAGGRRHAGAPWVSAAA